MELKFTINQRINNALDSLEDKAFISSLKSYNILLNDDLEENIFEKHVIESILCSTWIHIILIDLKYPGKIKYLFKYIQEELKTLFQNSDTLEYFDITFLSVSYFERFNFLAKELSQYGYDKNYPLTKIQ